MTTRSSRLRRLEHRFLEQFLVEVAGPDGALDLEEMDARFIRAWRALSRAADAQVSEDFADLLQRLRPDPITGVSSALWRSVHRLQPGRISMPNPGYQDGDVLGGSRETIDQLSQDLGVPLLPPFATAVAAYKA